MPNMSRCTLIWSQAHQYYELQNHGIVEQRFRIGDDSALSHWLEDQTSFAFVGCNGQLSLLKEARKRGSGYWYAYRKREQRTHKRYLGPSAQVTFARLEEQAKALASLPPSPTIEHPSTISAPQWTPLSGKLTPPRVPLKLVERSRLLGDLAAVHTHPLTLVSASAGCGKTTLLSAWVAALTSEEREKRPKRAGREQTVAWFSLDAFDDDPVRFWTSIIMALRYSNSVADTLGEEVLALLHAPQSPPLQDLLVTLLNELAQVGQEMILVLDDYHSITDQSIHDSLLFVLDHLPTNLHLVLATRIDPELPLARLRARGQLIEIRSSDLRFTQEEAASFLLQSMNLPLTQEDVAILSQRTEGWIAGLQLAALSLSRRENPSSVVREFAGSHRYLLDYVQQDVLARLPAPLQNFVLQTSILSHLYAAVCQAVTALPQLESSQEMLETLERANLFVIPLDEQRQWYRYHDLFREALLARLHSSQPQLVPLLHQRAASFYASAGDLRQAISHALAAPDYPLAASLISHAASQFSLQGEARTIQDWVLALPDAVLRSHLRLALDASLRYLNLVNLSADTAYTSMQIRVEQTIARVEGILDSQQEPALSAAETALVEHRLCLLRALFEAHGLLGHGSRERLRQLTLEIEALPPDEDESWNMIPLSCMFWLTAVLEQEGGLLVPRLLSAKRSMEMGDPLMRIRVRTWLADAYVQAGRLRQARQECLETLALIERTGGRTSWPGYLYYSLFRVSYARNQLEEAANWLQLSLRSARDWHQVILLIVGMRAQLKLALARGDLQGAQEALEQLEALVAQEEPLNQERWLIDVRLRLWLAQGKLDEAYSLQATLHTNALGPVRKEELLMRIRVLLACQQWAQAAELLDCWRQYLDLPGDIPTALEWMALSLVALHYTGQREQSLPVASRLFSLTEPEGEVRVFLDAGEPIRHALQMLLDSSQNAAPGVASSRSFVARLLALFGPAACPTTKENTSSIEEHEASARTTDSDVLIDPLSQQEMLVLRLLVAGQTYAEMAQTLVVSPNTIKTQVSSIYRKLGVGRRAEAIAASQRLRLL